MNQLAAESRTATVALPAAVTTRLWVAVAAVVLALLLIPEVVSQLAGPPDRERVHTFLNIWDFYVYVSALRESATTGSWLIHNHYAAPPHAPALIHVPYVAVGLLARSLGLDFMPVYLGAEWLGRAVTLLAVFAFVRLWVPDHRPQALAILIALGGSGLSFWALLLRAAWPSLASSDGAGLGSALYYELNSLTMLFSGLHQMLALSLSAAAVGAFWTSLAGAKAWLGVATLPICMGLLSLVHPHSLPPLFTAFGLTLLLTGLVDGRWGWAAATATFLGLVASGPMTVYSLVTFGLDPFWSGSQRLQNVVPSPPPEALLEYLGLPLLLGIWGLVVWRADWRARILVASLVLSMLAWMYSPVSFQRRFGLGLQLYLAPPAALACLWLWERARSGIGRRALVYAFLPLTFGSTMAMYLFVVSSAATGVPYPSYPHTRAEAEAAHWLGDRMGTDEVVLSRLESGYLLGGLLPGRVVVGHPHVTPNFAGVNGEVERFFREDLEAAERLRLAGDFGAQYLFFGPAERAVASFAPSTLDRFSQLYENSGVAIFRIEKER